MCFSYICLISWINWYTYIYVIARLGILTSPCGEGIRPFPHQSRAVAMEDIGRVPYSSIIWKVATISSVVKHILDANGCWHRSELLEIDSSCPSKHCLRQLHIYYLKFTIYMILSVQLRLQCVHLSVKLGFVKPEVLLDLSLSLPMPYFPLLPLRCHPEPL